MVSDKNIFEVGVTCVTKVPMKPTEDSFRTLRFTRITPTLALGNCSPSKSSVLVLMARPPKAVLPTRPFSLAPANIGTALPLYNPIRRLKKGIIFRLRPKPNSKMSAPSRKKARFSGKKSGKRVRLVCRVSTSVSAKSVLAVTV